MNKQFGQNFLIDPAARQRIIRELALEKGQTVWEVGPGIGAMTHEAGNSGAKLVLFEVDRGFCTLLRDIFPSDGSVELVEGDVLKTWIRREETPHRVFGNLPYNVGSIFIARLIEQECLPRRMVFTLQREVALRLCADPGTKLFSSFSLLGQLDYEMTLLDDIRPESFYPRPEVTSSVIRFDRKAESALDGRQRRLFLLLIRELFSSRRKTIRNNLKQGALKQQVPLEELLEAFAAAGVEESRRAETLPLDVLTDVTRRIALRIPS